MKTEKNGIHVPQMLHLRRSFANRVSLYAALIAGVIFIFTVSVGVAELRRTVRDNVQEDAEMQLSYINLEIGSLLSEIASTVNGYMPMIERELEKPTLDSAALGYYIGQIVEGNRKLRACNIAIETEHPLNHPFMDLYASRTDEGIRVRQIASPSFRYDCMDWYIIPKLKGEDFWSDPYISMMGDQAIICTYSLPIYDRQERLLGVLSADINTSYFSRYLRENSKYPNSYNIMLGEDAHYIVHPDDSNILSHTIFSLHMHDRDTNWHYIGHEMLAGHQGHQMVEHSRLGKMYAFYAPIHGINWSAAIVFAAQDIYADSQATLMRLLLYGLLGTLILFFVVRWIVKRIARPLIEMAASARKVADGDFHAELPAVTTQDELLVLHDSLLLMQSSLSTFMGQIQHNAAVQQRMDSELDMARNIQLGMLPQFDNNTLEDPRFDLAAQLRPAHTVGGDLYDFYLIDNYLYTVVADVSGKGFPASLLMVEARSMLRMVVRTVAEPSKILSHVNTSILETNNADMFITMFIGRLDLNTGEYIYSNAGHNPPLLLHNDRTVSEIYSDPNLPIGSFDDIQYEEDRIQLQPGEMVFIYTDGISEAENLKQELFGIDNIKETLSQCEYIDCRRAIETVDQVMLAFTGTAPQADDITALAFRYHTPEAPRPISKQINLSIIDELPQLAAAIEEMGQKHHLPEPLVFKLNLAVEEIVVNVIRYAFPDAQHQPAFEVHMRRYGDQVEFIVEDAGVPFDPTAAPEVDTTLPLEERDIGGLGIHLARHIMDTMTYSRFNNHNILRLKKNINNGNQN